MTQSADTEQRRDQVLVTGITGFVAGHIAAQLLRQGYRVRGTLRSMQRADAVESLLRDQPGCADGELSFAEADLMADDGWVEAVADCRYMIHTASPFPMRQPKNEDDLIRPAKEGTLRALAAARHAGVERVVLTSSVVAVNYGGGKAPFTEADWTDVDSSIATPYYKSKTVAEQAAWSFARDNGLELAVINPGLVLGPLLDARNSTSVDLVRQLLAGELPGIPNLGFPVADVRDVADAHLRAMTTAGAAGQRFIAAGPFLSVGELAKILRQTHPDRAGKLPKRKLPDWLVRQVARFNADLRSVVGDLGHDGRVSNARALEVLDWKPRDIIETVRDTADSLIRLGIV